MKSLSGRYRKLINQNTPFSSTHQQQAKRRLYWQSMAYKYEMHLADMTRRHPTAAMLKAGRCVRCGQCCYAYPCIPKPEELPAVAGYLHISVDELVSKYMVADTQNCKTFFLRWAKQGQEDVTGKRIPPLRTFDRGYCIFFDEESKTCRIHPVRPKEAKYIKCWEKGNGHDRTKWGISGWSKDDIYKLIPNFESHL